MADGEERIGKSADLILKAIRERRKCKVKVGRFTFQCRRPTDKEMADWYRAGARDADIYLNYVDGWEGVTENDLIGGGGSDQIAFRADLWREFIADRLDCWEPIVTAVLESYGEHQKDMEALQKK